MKNKNILQHYQGHEELVIRTEDYIKQSSRQVIMTPFLSEEEQAIVIKVCGKQVLYQFLGGYEQAQRKRCIFYNEYDEIDETQIVCILVANYASKYGRLTHRDVLGAIMHLGLERDQIGDIIIKDDCCYICCLPHLKNYLIENIKKIKRFSIQLEIYKNTIEYNQKLTYQDIIIPSMRLDVLVATICHLSRAKAQSLILKGYVKVNQVVLEDDSFLCHNEATISIRGYGKFKVTKTQMMTKKKRLVVNVATYV